MSIAHGLPIHLLYFLILFGASLYAYKYGGTTEKKGAALFVAASLATGASVIGRQNVFQGLEEYALIIDIVTWAGLVFLALTSSRFWPLWAAAFQTIAVITHVAVHLDRFIVPKAYAIGQGLWAYPILGALLVGAERCRRLRLRRAPTAWY